MSNNKRLSAPSSNATIITEMKEFSTMPKGVQRYIRRSLDIGLERTPEFEQRWARDAGEAVTIRAQAKLYANILPLVRTNIPTTYDGMTIADIFTPLLMLAQFDLNQRKLPAFFMFRFLYERLIDVSIRPILPAVFTAAAALPHFEPAMRSSLLQSIREGEACAAGWCQKPLHFFPEWVDKIQLEPQ